MRKRDVLSGTSRFYMRSNRLKSNWYRLNYSILTTYSPVITSMIIRPSSSASSMVGASL